MPVFNLTLPRAVKALLQIDGETLLARILRLARASGAQRLIVTLGPPHGKQLAAAGAELAAAQAETAQLTEQLGQPSLSGAERAEHGKRLKALAEEIETLESRWLELTDEIEGKTCAGTWVTGTGKDGHPLSTYLYHVVDNEETMAEYGSQAVVWQTAVNPVVALELVANGTWSGAGVLGPEAFDSVPFLDLLTEYGSPWGRKDLPVER